MAFLAQLNRRAARRIRTTELLRRLLERAGRDVETVRSENRSLAGQRLWRIIFRELKRKRKHFFEKFP